jgi:hypothetical protein
MAILQGFPPSNTISPSVRITEKDLSFVAPEQTFHRAGLIGFASKGPVNLPTLISTRRQLNLTFGYPHPDVSDPFLIYSAEQYLLVATELYVVRVADVDVTSDEQASTATVDVLAAGAVIDIISDTEGPYTFSEDGFFRWRLNGILSNKTLVVLADTYTTAELVVELNDQLDTQNDGIEFYDTEIGVDGSLGVRTVWAYGPESSLELVSVQNSIYGGVGSIVGLGTDMTQAENEGTATLYPDDGYGTDGFYNITESDQNIQIVVDGTDNVLIDGIVQVIDLGPDGADIVGSNLAIATIVTAINNQRTEDGGDLPGGWEAYVANTYSLAFRTKHFGRDAKLLVKASSTAAAKFGLETVTKIGESPVGQSGVSPDDTEALGLVTGGENLADDVTFTLRADSPGIDGNATQVRITNDIYDNVFTVEVFNNGNPVEAWGNLTKDDASTYYVETYLALVSDFIRVADNTAINAGPANGLYTLAGGSDGIPADPDLQDALLIGNAVGSTGLYTLSEPEQIDIDLIAIPGHSSTSVVLAMLDFCQNMRQDCMAIIDPPFGLTVNEIISWQNGTHPLNGTRFDSDFGALYWPWVRIRDGYNRIDVWVPPSGSIMAVYARSDFLGAPWFAPAGLTRGIVPGISDVYSRPTLSERDLMYGNRNCINPIVQFVDVDGFLVWGQKTLQRRPTALDRVNVRRLMFYLEKRIRSNSRALLFEPNDEVFRDRFIRIARGILDQVKVGRGLTDYIIKADEELNTPDVIDRNEFRAQIGVQPTRAAEFIFIEFSIHRTGSFVENADTF